jgi:hypothetical protein
MLARRTKIYQGDQQVADTPLLLPSFSSKGFPDVQRIMRFMSGFITSGVLVSAYDLHYEHLRVKKLVFPEIVFLDCGGYEARVEHDLSESYGRAYKPKRWNRQFYERVLKGWTPTVPTVAVTFDSPVQFLKTKAQIQQARDLQVAHPRFLWDLLITPENKKADFISVETLIKNVDLLRPFPIIGFTEKQLGKSVWDRMVSLAKLRIAMDEAKVEAPIHIFGSLDTLSTVYYFIAGAEIFDGLTWLRFGYHEGSTIYTQNYGMIRDDDGLHRNLEDQYYDMWTHNYYYLVKLRTQMINFSSSGDFSKFGSIGARVEDAYQQLEAEVMSASKAR